MNTSGTDTRVYRLRWWTLLVLSVSTLIILLDSTIVNVALPTLQGELNASFEVLQWIVNSYILIFGALLLLTGVLGDRWGRARMWQAGLVVFGGASLGAANVASGGQLIAWRLVMGIGAAMIAPSTLSIIANVFPREERNTAIGAWMGVVAIGVAMGPIVGGALIDNFDWNVIFLVNIPIAIVTLVAGWFLVPNSREPNPGRPDILGTVLSTAGLAALVFGLIQVGGAGWTDPVGIVSLAGAIVLIVSFILWERYTTDPMLDMGLWRSRRFSVGALGIGLTAFREFGLLFGYTLYLQFVQGYSALETGLRFLPLSLGLFLGAGTSGKAVARFGTKSVMAFSFLLNFILVAFVAFWQVDTAYWQIGLIFSGIGFSLGYCMAPATDAVMGAVPEEKAGRGSAMSNLSELIGGAIGVATLTAALSSAYSSSFEKAARAISGLPAEIAEAAKDSVGVALMIAPELTAEVGNALTQAANESFMDGLQAMVFVVCGINVLGMLLVLKFMPQRHEPIPEVGPAMEGEAQKTGERP